MLGMEEFALILSISFELPVFATAIYWLILAIFSIKEHRSNEIFSPGKPREYPPITLLYASYNEKLVIENSLEAIMKVDYPLDRIQVVVADDSNDETVGILDRKAQELSARGLKIRISRRTGRTGFKIGALKNAMHLVRNDLVLLLDADSVLKPETISDGIRALEINPKLSFVQFRVGYYNRSYNFITRLFALSQDLMDTSIKKGSAFLRKPFSIQGGFTLIRRSDLDHVMEYNLESITEDTEITVLLNVNGKKGTYLSYSKILSEAPFDLEIWKKQSLRVSQGWGLIVRKHWMNIFKSRKMSYSEKAGIMLLLLLPFSNISWIIVNIFSSVFTFWAFLLGLPFDLGGPFYSIFLFTPSIPFFVAGAYALYFEGLFKPKDLILLPALSYIGACTVVLGAYGFMSGLLGKSGYFYRTPKMGAEEKEAEAMKIRDKVDIPLLVFEFAVASLGLALGVMMALSRNFLPALTLFGFALVTFKSMNLKDIGFVRKLLPGIIKG